MKKSVFYHAGCPVCVSAEQEIVALIGEKQVDIIHLGNEQSHLAHAKEIGVKSVPALVTPNENVLHINFGASIEDLEA